MPNPKINNINVGGVDYDIGSTVLSFDTYADYLAASQAGDVPVGSTVFIKEGNQSLITANQVSYGDSSVKVALDQINNDLSARSGNISELGNATIAISELKKYGKVVTLSASVTVSSNLNANTWLDIFQLPSGFIPTNSESRCPFVTRANKVCGITRFNPNYPQNVQMYVATTYTANDPIDINFTYIIE